MMLGQAEPRGVAAIRNVVLVGPSGSGKTTLAEHLIASAGVTPVRGSVDAGTSTLDYEPAARRQKRSVALTVASFDYGDILINLLDTPGFVDYFGEVRAGMRAADAALFVISATDGIDAATRALWDECESIHMPRAIVVTNLDDDDSDFDETVAICHRMFVGGRDVLPLHLPVLDDDGSFIGVLDLITNRIHEWSTAEHQETSADPEHLSVTAEARADLIEGIAAESEDEALMDLIVSGEAVSAEVLTADLERAIARGHFHPVQAFSGANGIGAALILDLIARALPSPLERALPLVTSAQGDPISPLTADPDGPLCAEVIKTTTDPYLGKVSLVRVFSGRLPPDAPVHISGHFLDRGDRHDHDLTEREGHLSLVLGATHRPVQTAVAGSIVSVTRLSRAETGDTISYVTHPLLIEPWVMPVPGLPMAIAPTHVADEHRLTTALERLVAEDPSLRFELIEGQSALWCLGEAHAELALERLRERFDIEVTAEELKITMRETFVNAASGQGVLDEGPEDVGPYARCTIQIEPSEQGSGVAIINAIGGDALPHNLLAAVERGIRRRLAQGSLAGYPTTDVRVSIMACDVHPDRTTDHACERAGALAVADCEAQAVKHLLEPIETLTVHAPAEFADAISSDITGRRGRVTSTQFEPDGHVTVTATVPAQELSRYAIDIRSISHGTGSFTHAAAGFARVPKKTGIRLLPMLD